MDLWREKYENVTLVHILDNKVPVFFNSLRKILSISCLLEDKWGTWGDKEVVVWVINDNFTSLQNFAKSQVVGNDHIYMHVNIACNVSSLFQLARIWNSNLKSSSSITWSFPFIPYGMDVSFVFAWVVAFENEDKFY